MRWIIDIITAKATDGGNVTATCAVNVGISSVEGVNADGIKIVPQRA